MGRELVLRTIKLLGALKTVENYPIVVLRVGRLGVRSKAGKVEGKRNNGGVRRRDAGECHARLRKNKEGVSQSIHMSRNSEETPQVG